MSPSGNKESLFVIDFDIDTPINIEVKHSNTKNQEHLSSQEMDILFYVKESREKTFQVGILATFRNS